MSCSMTHNPLESPDWHHSAPSRLDVFDIGGRYVGIPKGFHDIVYYHLSQDTCRHAHTEFFEYAVKDTVYISLTNHRPVVHRLLTELRQSGTATEAAGKDQTHAC